eukprot:scaffold11726_cov112-Cylindrotheca_fusiformis.AAC.6
MESSLVLIYAGYDTRDSDDLVKCAGNDDGLDNDELVSIPSIESNGYWRECADTVERHHVGFVSLPLNRADLYTTSIDARTGPNCADRTYMTEPSFKLKPLWKT